MLMLKVILMLALGLTCSSAMAGWTKVHEYTKATVYVNLATIQRDENLVKMWSMSDYKSPQHAHQKESFRSIKTQAEFDCNERKRRIVSITLYSGKKSDGDVVYSNAYFDKPWLPIVLGSLEDHEWEIACKNNVTKS
jgi:hypothetical protein